VDAAQELTTERDLKMSRNRSFQKRAREEVERIKAEETTEVERKQARMRELVEEARERREAEAVQSRGGATESGTPSSGAPRRRRPKARSCWPGMAPSAAGRLVAVRRLCSSRRGRRCGRRCSKSAPWTPIGGRVKLWPEAASAAFRDRSQRDSEQPPRGGSAAAERSTGSSSAG
jgi:hypothetical protein